jgi:hypothetical protein
LADILAKEDRQKKETNINFNVDKSKSEISQTTEQQQQVFKLTNMLQDHENISLFLSSPHFAKTESLQNNDHPVTESSLQVSEEVTVDTIDNNVETRTEDQIFSLQNMLKDFSEEDRENSHSYATTTDSSQFETTETFSNQLVDDRNGVSDSLHNLLLQISQTQGSSGDHGVNNTGNIFSQEILTLEGIQFLTGQLILNELSFANFNSIILTECCYFFTAIFTHFKEILSIIIN